MWIFYSTLMVGNSVLEKLRMRRLNTKRGVPHFRTLAYVWTKHPEHWISIKTRKWAQYLWTWRQSVVPNDAPRDFGPEVAFGAKFQIPVARQGGREMSAPRPYETDPFHPLGSTLTKKSFSIYIEKCTSYFFHVVGTSGSWYGVYLTITHALL